MKILTLFLALFLTMMPESSPIIYGSQGQDFLLEVVCDVEEEAVIRTPQTASRMAQKPSEATFTEFRPSSVRTSNSHPIHICLERQWLKACTLRL